MTHILVGHDICLCHFMVGDVMPHCPCNHAMCTVDQSPSTGLKSANSIVRNWQVGLQEHHLHAWSSKSRTGLDFIKHSCTSTGDTLPGVQYGTDKLIICSPETKHLRAAHDDVIIGTRDGFCVCRKLTDRTTNI